jgi:hypothetical protein
MLALDIVPLKTFVIERQALIAKVLHSFLDENPMIRVVGDAPSVRVEDRFCRVDEYRWAGSTASITSRVGPMLGFKK